MIQPVRGLLLATLFLLPPFGLLVRPATPLTAAFHGSLAAQDRVGPNTPDAEGILTTFYASHPNAGQYLDQRPAIRAQLESTARHDLPLAPLVSLLYEGAAKRVSPPRLLEALAREQERLSAARDILSNAGLPVGVGAMERLSVYLQAGVSRQVLAALAPDAASLDHYLLLIEALAEVVATNVLADTHLTRLGRALLSSNLSPNGYGIVASAYVKGRLQGLSTERITDVVVRVLNRGGGIIQIDRELSTRGRRS